MTRTLITGAAGFTGRYLAQLLSERGDEVHGLVHVRGDPAIEGVAAIHEADLADLKAVSAIVDDIQPYRVVHLAAISFVGHADIEEMYRANVLGTRQLLEVLACQARAPGSIVLASSANVYGNSQEGIIDESSGVAPANDYAVTKVAMEYVASIYAARLPLIVTRPFNYTGPGQGSEFIIPKIVAHARDRSSLIELGNLDVARDFSDVRTVVDAYARLLDEPKAVGGTFNICSGRAVALREVIDLVSELSGHHFDVRINPAFVRASEVRTLCGSPEKLEQVIGPLRSISLEDTLRWMLEA